MTSRTLIMGACGQIGSEIVRALRERDGVNSVVATDIYDNNPEVVNSGKFEFLDAKDYEAIKDCLIRNDVDTVYLMAAILSAKGEQYPQKAWDLNMTTLFNVLNLAKEGYIKKLFWPSSIAVFGPTTPRLNTPQHTIMEPATVYGITKQVGERWCEYYHKHHDVDVRSLRYPGIISWRTKPGGGTTDYAVEIFHKALDVGQYECFLSEDTQLPMMYMEDAVNATLLIMDAPSKAIKTRSSYNLAAISFSPREIAASIQKQLSQFTMTYAPDFRQSIADSWPNSIDDSPAREDWKWEHAYDLDAITEEMLKKLTKTQLT